ncbi:hypothetical protein CLOM_g8546 [Closterium sp. NIES-68]|nr:hypothetical protein CLOM_g19644 [Closterium sp. NIES-68]GJP35402.1 hypothetical protein CLOM_g19913 [Closterium sp. NIES-68]GJP49321.1 hypothetical protein CLOM_g8546 [Closterium sp. NIES-68]GJP74664.1 hypothetical protein CLOP_g5217 [Closterium sp. NIES-67]GJP83750.1 hypothetical protein CLOP_g13864 [Closterium sp. NIES-67]
MAKFAKQMFSVLVLLSLVCFSHLPLASAGAPKRVARTRQAHGEFRRQRQLAEKQDGGASAQGQEIPIKYWGGPVMTGNPSVNVYIIYYGSWPAGSGQGVIGNFIRSLSADSGQQGSAADPKVKHWWAINAPYSQEADGEMKNVSRKVRLAGIAYDDYSVGDSFEDGTAWEVVSSKIGDGKEFPYDPHGIYLLLISKDVSDPGFCTKYCGWHTMGFIESDAVIYSLVGHPGQCPACGTRSTSPNGKPAIDAMLSTIAHEIAEAATDPDVESGWFDDEGEENADKCAWSFGATKTCRDNRGKTYEYNLVGMKGMRFLIQQNWDVLTNTCVMQRK